MDPASAIGIAAASIEFARFTYEFITAVKKLYSSTSGQLLDNETQESLINRMDDLASRTKFNKPLADLSNEERAINEVANECKRISDAIISNLGKIEAKKGKDGKPSLKESIKAAGKGMFAKKDMDQLQKHLNHFMTQLLRQKTVLESHEVKTALETLLEAKDLHMHKLNRIRTDMNSGVPLNSNALIQIRAIFSPSDRELQLANERAILQLLWFDTINSRHCEIFEAETNTFTWILNDSNVQRLSNPLLVTDFKTWLQTGSGVFHISGKPGSGKSTLMKYLCESAETERHLQQWVDPSKTLVFAKFFFWRHGKALQTSLYGLIRSLVYHIIDQCPELIPELFPGYWNPAEYTSSASKPFLVVTEKGVQTAFDKIVDGKGNFPNHQFCFFIDGLDEFEGPNASSWWDLAQSLKLWADKNDRVKICVATREWNEFDHTFQIQQRLRLQDLTRNDLVQVVHSRLAIEKQRRADYFLNLEKQDVAILTNLEQEVVSKAEGVFLWVRLVLEQLYTAFNYRYDHHQLHQKMQEIPTKLKEFFEYILKTIPKDDQQDAYTMLYFAMSTLKNSMRLDPLQSGNRKELPLLQYAFLNNYTKNRRFTEDLETQGRDTKNLEHFLEGARALVTGKCRGLLEVQSAAQRSRNRQVQRSSEVNREFATISNDQHAQQCSAINQDHAIFAHRSILEFLEEHLHDRSFDFVDAYIQTSVAIVKYVPFPDDRTAFLDIHTWTLHAVMTTMFQHEKGMDSLIHYHSLEDLNTALNDRQRVPDWSVATPVESKPSRLTGTDLRKERLVSVHHLAAWCGFHKYLAWMLATTPNVPQAADGAELVQMALLRMQVEAYLPLRNTKAPESSQTLRVLFKGRIDTNSFSNRPQDKGLTIWEAFVLGNTFRHAATQEFFEIVIFFLENGAYVPGWAPTVPGQIGEQQRKVTISFGKREIILKRWNKHQISRGRKLSSYDPFQFSESLTEYGKQITLRDFLARAIDHAARCHGKEKEKKDLELLAKRLDHVLRQSEKGKPGVLQAIGLPEAETIAYIAVAVIIAMIAILPTQRGTTQLYHILLRSLSSYHNQMADFLQRAALPWAILGTLFFMSIYTSKRISRVKLILQKWVDRYGKTSLDDLGKDVSIQSEPDNVSYHVKGHE